MVSRANFAVAIMQLIRGRRVLREGVAQLLCRPGRRGVRGDRHVDDAPTVVPEDDEDEQQPDVTVGTRSAMTSRCSEARDRTRNRSEWSRKMRTDARSRR
jgi:hypothetical protein